MPAGRSLARFTPLLAHASMFVAALVLLAAIRRAGDGLTAPATAPGSAHRGGAASLAGATAAPGDALLHVLLALAVVIVAARVVGALFRHLRQPPVIGEVVAGLLLGPSLLGRVAPEVSGFLLPPRIAPYLGVLSQVGVILYMFLVGLELDLGQLRRRGRVALAISNAGILVPFLLGAALALPLYPRFATADVPFTVYALFVGTALSVTAFPVLARILTDRGIQRSGLGMLALACAAADDATAWCLLALVASVARARPEEGLRTAALALAYGAVMLAVVRPLLARALRERAGQPLSREGIAAVFVMLLVSALVTEAIGIHALFGAFLLGAVLPHDGELAHGLRQRLEDVVGVLLLPAFFAFVGMRTQIGLLSGAAEWTACAVIIAVASLGKFGGATLAARLGGIPLRESAALGVLMNTRGLMELIVLNLGLDLGVISPTLFAMMVVMALVTTLATAPLLHALTAGHEELVAPARTA